MRCLLLVGVLVGSSSQAAEVVNRMLDELRAQAMEDFTAEAGRAVWFRNQNGRSCTSCHTDAVRGSGRHERTGKIIEPMAPSVNAERLTDRKKIDKWFLRNCKWTFRRECTAQEKGDVLVWLMEQ
ncbi:MAG: DUF1924 domain-containing protein [Pseudomonadales bacterium]